MALCKGLIWALVSEWSALPELIFIIANRKNNTEPLPVMPEKIRDTCRGSPTLLYPRTQHFVLFNVLGFVHVIFASHHRNSRAGQFLSLNLNLRSSARYLHMEKTMNTEFRSHRYLWWSGCELRLIMDGIIILQQSLNLLAEAARFWGGVQQELWIHWSSEEPQNNSKASVKYGECDFYSVFRTEDHDVQKHWYLSRLTTKVWLYLQWGLWGSGFSFI